jgi:hypothetical protein
MNCTLKAYDCHDKKKDGSCGWTLEGKGYHCAYAVSEVKKT